MLYNIQAKVFAKKIGKDFSRIVHVTVVANNNEDAIEQGKRKIENLCATLEKNHNNIFDYTDLIIE